MRDERPEVARLAGNALDAAAKATGLTSQLLASARRQRLDPQPLDPAEVVEGMRGLLARTLGERITLRVEAEPEAGACLADRNQLESALLSLTINARDAIGAAAGTVAISVRAEHVEAAPEGWPPDGDYVRIAVRDDGPGMPEEVRRRAFEPFFTTKGPGKGTGLGLAQLHGLAHQSGGTVRIESAPGQGTEVAILLPKCGKPVRRCTEAFAPTPEPEAGFGETVLVVEDDAMVRALHHRPRPTRHLVERWRRAAARLVRGRDRRLRRGPDLHPRGPRCGRPGARGGGGAGRGPCRERALAPTPRRIAVLGQRAGHAAARSGDWTEWAAVRPAQDHAGPDGAAAGGGGAAGE